MALVGAAKRKSRYARDDKKERVVEREELLPKDRAVVCPKAKKSQALRMTALSGDLKYSRLDMQKK